MSLYSLPQIVVGIVGSEAAKFTRETETVARSIIRGLLFPSYVAGLASGRCHLGGIDIWAEEIASEIAHERDFKLFIYPPADLSWFAGYRPRNLQIVRASDIVHCITVRNYPPGYKGMRFDGCYHCHTNDHVKSGGCWTAVQAHKAGKLTEWHII